MHNEVSQAINSARKLLITMRKVFDTRVQEAAGKLGEEAEGKLETDPDRVVNTSLNSSFRFGDSI
jgi:hypothetical protein